MTDRAAVRFETGPELRTVAVLVLLTLGAVLTGAIVLRWMLGAQPMVSITSPGVIGVAVAVLALQVYHLPRRVVVTQDTLCITRSFGRSSTLPLAQIARVERTRMGLHVQTLQGRLTSIDYCRDSDGLAQMLEAAIPQPPAGGSPP